MGYSLPPSVGWGTPPPTQTWDGVPRLSGPGMGYLPPPSRTGTGPPPPTRDGVPPPPRCGLTRKVKLLPSPILRMRAVMISLQSADEKHYTVKCFQSPPSRQPQRHRKSERLFQTQTPLPHRHASFDFRTNPYQIPDPP